MNYDGSIFMAQYCPVIIHQYHFASAKKVKQKPIYLWLAKLLTE